jgi:hypothetical protein
MLGMEAGRAAILRNFWNLARPLPQTWSSGTTGYVLLWRTNGPQSDATSTPVTEASPSQTERPVTPERLRSPPSLTVRRSGRLSKKASQSRGARGHTGPLGLKLRRKIHDNFRLRPRPRLHERVDDLWKVIPKEEKDLQVGAGSSDDGREPCRADKVVVAIAYIRKLQGQLASLDEGRS